MNIIIALLILGIIIFIHELGHFLAARFFKMPVSEFAIGMGLKLYSYYDGKTTYAIRIIPFGGYVSIEGMEVGSQIENGFNSKSPIARFIVLFAGVFMNFILAFIVVIGITFSTGKITQNDEAIIGNILKTSKAFNILKPNDKILKIDEIKISNWNDVLISIKNLNKKNNNLNILLERDNKKLLLNVPLTQIEGKEALIIGIEPQYNIKKYGFIEGIKDSIKIFIKVFENTLDGLKMLVTGKVEANEISGPVGIIKVVGEASSNENKGILIWLLAVLSINVGIFNLLPLPALDGGRIVFVIFEIFGIKVNKKFEEKLHYIGMILLLGIILIATANDFLNILK